MTNHILSFLKVIGYDERRKARNFLLKPALQMKLPLLVLFLSFAFASLTYLVGYVYFEQLYIMMLENTTQGSYLYSAMNEQTDNFKEALAMMLVGYVILMVGITVVYTHRIIGPTVAMKRHIKALKEGLYSHRINLRPRDELKDIAIELNELAETLEQYKNRGTADN